MRASRIRAVYKVMMDAVGVVSVAATVIHANVVFARGRTVIVFYDVPGYFKAWDIMDFFVSAEAVLQADFVGLRPAGSGRSHAVTVFLAVIAQLERFVALSMIPAPQQDPAVGNQIVMFYDQTTRSFATRDQDSVSGQSALRARMGPP